MRDHNHAMPNQPAKDKFHTSISMPDDLMAQIDAYAKKEERSRNQIIVRFCRKGMDEINRADPNYNTIPDTKSA
jgi:metal-responsive CopG/Arc/MetJ family transcriptional regulator